MAMGLLRTPIGCDSSKPVLSLPRFGGERRGVCALGWLGFH